MRLTGSGAYSRPAPVPKMPPGLVQLMEGLTRDVLQHNPTDVFDFCAQHMEQLLIIRDGRAPSKRRLTLEEKIKRAQEKVREKAEQRRLKYDEELKKYNEAIKAGTISAEEIMQEATISNQEEKPVLEEVKSSAESIMETKLKAPVHHEQDLTEALEVEIFHKSVEETLASNTPDSKDPDDNLEKETTVQNESLNIIKENNDTNVKPNDSDLQERVIVTLDEKDVNGLLEQTIVNESITADAHDHVRTRRSVVSEENEESKQEANDQNVEVVEEQNNVTDTIVNESITADAHEHVGSPRSVDSEESKQEANDVNVEDVEEQNNVTENSNELKTEPKETVSDKINNDLGTTISDNTTKIDKCEKKYNNEATIPESSNDIDTDIKNNIVDTLQQEIDSATIFANEVIVTAPTPEALKDNIDIVQDDNDNKVTEVTDDKQESPIPVTYGDDVKLNDLSVTEDKLSHNEEPKEKVNVRVEGTVQDFAELEEIPVLVEAKNILSKNKPPENGSTIEVSNGDASSKEAEQESNENKVDVKVDENTASNDNTSVKESELSVDRNDNDKPELKEKEVEQEISENKQVLEATLEPNLDESLTSFVYENSDIHREKEVLPLDNDEKIIEAVEQLEVCTDPIEIHLDEKDKSLNASEHLASENSDNETTSKIPEKELEIKVNVIESQLLTEDNSDGAVTTVDKVLVEEPSDSKDDNDSAPEQKVVQNNTTENGVHMNGTHADRIEDMMENGNESSEHEIIPADGDEVPKQNTSNEKEIIPEINDDVTSTSEPIKTDQETSSLGKSSSMDDSLIEEGVDAIPEIDEPSTESTHKNETSSGMDLETAAVTIQKVFRTFLFKSRESTFDDAAVEGNNSIDGDSEKTEVEFPVSAAAINKERRTLGISRMDTVLQTVNEEKSLSLSTDDSSLSSAATIIQAHVRGFLTRNRLNSNKTNSSSLVNSEGPSSTSLENDPEQKVNKTVLNIHIVPEGEHFMSRDESLLTSMELSLDGSPPSSTNLHPLGYDKSEPRKQLKREDAIQSISPPSNNSGKLSEDSVKEMPLIDSEQQKIIDGLKDELREDLDIDRDDTPTKSTTIETVIEAHKLTKDASSSPEPEKEDVETAVRRKRSLNLSSDEGDVITPYEEKNSSDSDATSRLLHSGEFHDVVLPTKVLRGDTSVVREFKNVLAYFLIWNNS